MDDSHISYDKNGDATGFMGFDAVNLYRATVLWSGIRLLQQGIQPTRGFTMTKALKMASNYTHKPYKRTESDKARADLKVWIDEMKAALPVVQQ